MIPHLSLSALLRLIVKELVRSAMPALTAEQREDLARLRAQQRPRPLGTPPRGPLPRGARAR